MRPVVDRFPPRPGCRECGKALKGECFKIMHTVRSMTWPSYGRWIGGAGPDKWCSVRCLILGARKWRQ